MATYSNHWQVTASGTLAGDVTQEIFSFGFALGNPGTHTDTWQNLVTSDGVGNTGTDDRDDIADLVAAYFSRPTTQIRPEARLKMVKIAKIGTNGKYVEPPWAKIYDTPGGSTDQGRYPAQIACAVSMRGPVDLKRVTGRHYIPLPTLPLGADLRFNQTAVQQLRGSAATLVNALNDLQNENRVIIASSRGFNARVVEVRVGRVPDTIRRRRGDLDEAYEAVAIPD